MSELTFAKSVVLGIVQGVTEFLPVSSSAHLAITQRWLHLEPHATPLLLFDLMVHLGTLAAVYVVFAKPIHRYLTRLIRECRPGFRPRRRQGWRIALLAMAATVPTGAIGLSFQDTFEEAFNRPVWIGFGLLITGTLLVLTLRAGRGRGRWRDFSWWQAVAVGCAQALAIFPGISRSGSTISIASFFGLRRQWAAQFSFLISFPAILGAAVIKFRDALRLPKEDFAAIPWGPVFCGAAMSFVVGVAALVLLLQVIRRAKLHYFAAYCWALGVLLVLRIV